jgi:hypothetical protein
LEPGFTRVEIRPQLADLPDLDLVVHTVRGPIAFRAGGQRGQRALSLRLPAGCEGELVLVREERVGLTPATGPAPAGSLRYRVPPATETTLELKFT